MPPYNSFSRPRRATTRLTAVAPTQQQPDYGPPQATIPAEVAMPEKPILSPFMQGSGTPSAPKEGEGPNWGHALQQAGMALMDKAPPMTPWGAQQPNPAQAATGDQQPGHEDKPDFGLALQRAGYALRDNVPAFNFDNTLHMAGPPNPQNGWSFGFPPAMPRR